MFNLNTYFMLKSHPFMDLRVNVCTYNPDPEVPYIDTDESSGNEVLRKLPASLFFQSFPLVKDRITLQDYLDSGVPIRQVATKLYESNDFCDSPWTEQEIYDKFEQLINEARQINFDTSTKTEE